MLWVLCKDQSLDISEIITETSMEPSPIILEENGQEVLQTTKGEVNAEPRGEEIYYFSR